MKLGRLLALAALVGTVLVASCGPEKEKDRSPESLTHAPLKQGTGIN